MRVARVPPCASNFRSTHRFPFPHRNCDADWNAARDSLQKRQRWPRRDLHYLCAWMTSELARPDAGGAEESPTLIWKTASSLTRVAQPNGVRLSCAAVLWFSQLQFYYDGRRPLQPLVRLRTEDRCLGAQPRPAPEEHQP